MVAHEPEGVAPLDERQSLVDQAFELDRPDLGAVLLALHPVDLAMEEIDEGPEQVGEIILEAGLAECLPEDVEDVVQRCLAGMGLRQGPVIRST